jgi:hypothetical protein
LLQSGVGAQGKRSILPFKDGHRCVSLFVVNAERTERLSNAVCLVYMFVCLAGERRW